MVVLASSMSHDCTLFTGEKRDVYQIKVNGCENPFFLHFLGRGNWYHSLSLRQPMPEDYCNERMASEERKMCPSKIQTTYQNLKIFHLFPHLLKVLRHCSIKRHIQVTCQWGRLLCTVMRRAVSLSILGGVS